MGPRLGRSPQFGGRQKPGSRFWLQRVRASPASDTFPLQSLSCLHSTQLRLTQLGVGIPVVVDVPSQSLSLVHDPVGVVVDVPEHLWEAPHVCPVVHCASVMHCTQMFSLMSHALVVAPVQSVSVVHCTHA